MRLPHIIKLLAQAFDLCLELPLLGCCLCQLKNLLSHRATSWPHVFTYRKAQLTLKIVEPHAWMPLTAQRNDRVSCTGSIASLSFHIEKRMTCGSFQRSKTTRLCLGLCIRGADRSSLLAYLPAACWSDAQPPAFGGRSDCLLPAWPYRAGQC